MDEHSIIHFIILYRHDLMNHLQLLSSFHNMGNITNVENKMNEIIHYYNEERKLFSLNAPKLTLYLLFFNHHYANKNLTYHVEIDNVDLSLEDEKIYNQNRQMFSSFKDKNDFVMYNWRLHIHFCNKHNAVKFSYSISNEQIEENDFKQLLDNKSFAYPIQVIKKQKCILIYFFVPSK